MDDIDILPCFASSSKTLDPGTAPSTSPLSSDQDIEDTSISKKLIQTATAIFVCSYCKTSFTSNSRYKQHENQRSCRAQFSCHDCGRKFRHQKDLHRHLGSKDAAPSCPKLKTVTKIFACTCGGKPYTRKDTLQRHIDRSNSRSSNKNHQCITCRCCRCRCRYDANSGKYSIEEALPSLPP